MEHKRRVLIGLAFCIVVVAAAFVIDRNVRDKPSAPQQPPAISDPRLNEARAPATAGASIGPIIAISVAAVLVAIIAYFGPFAWILAKTRRRNEEARAEYEDRLAKYLTRHREKLPGHTPISEAEATKLASELTIEQLSAANASVGSMFRRSQGATASPIGGIMHRTALPWLARIFPQWESAEDRLFVQNAVRELVYGGITSRVLNKKPLPLSGPLFLPGTRQRVFPYDALGSIRILPNLRYARGLIFLGLGILCAAGAGIAASASPDSKPVSALFAVLAAVFLTFSVVLRRGAMAMYGHLTDKYTDEQIFDLVDAKKAEIGARFAATGHLSPSRVGEIPNAPVP